MNIYLSASSVLYSFTNSSLLPYMFTNMLMISDDRLLLDVLVGSASTGSGNHVSQFDTSSSPEEKY